MRSAWHHKHLRGTQEGHTRDIGVARKQYSVGILQVPFQTPEMPVVVSRNVPIYIYLIVYV